MASINLASTVHDATFDLSALFPEQDERFRRLWRRVLFVFVVCGVIVPWLPVREQTREKQEALPPRLAKVLIQKQQLPPPKPESIGQAKPKEKEALGGVEHPVAASASDKTAAIRRKVAKKGVLAFRKELKQLREARVLSALTNNAVIALNKSAAPQRSDGQKLVEQALQVGGGEKFTLPGTGLKGDVSLANRQATRIEWVGTGEGRGGGTGFGGKSGKRGRSAEEIDWVMQRVLGSLQLLFNKELRVHPDRRGRVAVQLTIAPSGEVTACQVLSSELSLPEFEKKIVMKIKSLDFGSKDIGAVTLVYPIDFVPATSDG
ncbi:MAG: AgmX/PglI C-terminal domain-containing protein [Pseudomonadota bacterium]